MRKKSVAIQFIPILKALAPIIAEGAAAAAGMAGLRKASSGMKEHETLGELEEKVLRIGRVTVGLAQQTKAAIEEQAAANAAFDRRIKFCLFISTVALAVALIALILVVLQQ